MGAEPSIERVVIRHFMKFERDLNPVLTRLLLLRELFRCGEHPFRLIHRSDESPRDLVVRDGPRHLFPAQSR